MVARNFIARLPELEELHRIAERKSTFISSSVIETISYQNQEFPIFSFSAGSQTPDTPTFILVGGVHGLERIGTRVVVAYLKTLAALLEWDDSLHHLLHRVRLVMIPLVNPVGMFLNQRANGQGVDLMRNAPIDSDVNNRFSLISGHRISPKLPWYRGPNGAPMERESLALINAVEAQLKTSKAVFCLDVHSGFGIRDRLWFPYAKSRKPFPDLAKAYALMKLLDSSYPNHIYKMEPQSNVYTTHGDLWDYIYTTRLRDGSQPKLFLPLTLELGSWNWIRKNPKQVFSTLGIFNPILPHRMQRTLMRHLILIDFLIRATASHTNWISENNLITGNFQNLAEKHWYKSVS